jgi:type I thyroxine 5'-deiodinase
MEDLAKQYSHVADFAYIYIKEAHADDEWQVEKNKVGDVIFNQPQTFEERLILAQAFQEAMGTETTILVDDITNTANAAYAAWPERIYVLDTDGKIIYKGRMGPFYFDPDEIVPVLEKHAVKEQRPS